MIEPPNGASVANDHFYIIVAGIVAVLVVLIPALVSLIITFRRGQRVANDLAEVKEQVKNSHTTNLREEADDRHEENSGKLNDIANRLERTAVVLTGISSSQTDMQQDMREMKLDIASLTKTSDKHTKQIDDLEQTNDHKFDLHKE